MPADSIISHSPPDSIALDAGGLQHIQRCRYLAYMIAYCSNVAALHRIPSQSGTLVSQFTIYTVAVASALPPSSSSPSSAWPTLCPPHHPHHRLRFSFFKRNHSTHVGVWAACSSFFGDDGRHEMMILGDGIPMYAALYFLAFYSTNKCT